MNTQTTNLKVQSLAIKVASRCNLNCSYCYIYNMGDNTYLKQPKFMNEEVEDALLEKVVLHCQKHKLHKFFFVFFGGEPLLTGQKAIRRFVEKTKAKFLPEGILPEFGVQSNGLLIDDEWCNLFAELEIAVGISLDGMPEINDMYRVDHKGRGSYHQAVKGLQVAQKSQAMQKKFMKPSINCVINLNADPIEVYEHFKALNAEVDFLLPDANYFQPPAGHENADGQNTDWSNTPYADWLIPIFDQWFYEAEPKSKISIFKYIMILILGGNIANDHFGKDRCELLIIETNGDVEASDSFKACGNGFTESNINVLNNELDDALKDDLSLMYQFAKDKLCQQCNVCPVGDICGGGFIVNRYSEKNGFNNPSVYCADLLKLITHIQNKIVQELPAGMLEDYDISPLKYTEAQQMIKQTLAETNELEYVSDLEQFKQ